VILCHLCLVQLSLVFKNQTYVADLSAGIDLSLSIGPGGDNPNAFHIQAALFEPIRVGDFVGAVAEGGSANCEVLTLCPHGNGTHTECVGHILKNRYTVPEALTQSYFLVQVLSVELDQQEERSFLAEAALHGKLRQADALCLRSLPNSAEKRSMVWSGNEPPYISEAAMHAIVQGSYTHLLTDFPSVDPEEDAGALAAHRIWWNVPSREETLSNPEGQWMKEVRWNACITEMVYVPEIVEDGLYLLHIQTPSLRTDAVPSKPVLYPILP
jgi:kynurenine formamidase